MLHSVCRCGSPFLCPYQCWLLCLSLLQSVRQIWDSVFDLCPCGLHGFEVSIFQLWAFIQQVVCGQ